VEGLESVTLLSGISATAAVTMAAMSREIHLSGQVEGAYHAREIPDAGKFYTFSGHGPLSPLGQVNMTGNVDLPGLLISPITGTPPRTPEAFGQVVLSSPGGSLTLTLSAPSSDNASLLPDVFRYTVTSASGKFKGDTGSGTLKIMVTPSPAPANPVASLGTEHGTFTLVFVPTPSATGNPAS
jgi:hypothetical protein